jgi:hypothetical protein
MPLGGIKRKGLAKNIKQRVAISNPSWSYFWSRTAVVRVVGPHFCLVMKPTVSTQPMVKSTA